MTRIYALACLLALLTLQAIAGQSQSASAPQTSTAQAPSQAQAAHPSDEENPPEEDESVAPEKYVLNPLESERNVKVGNYYWHHGKFRAAAERYQRATKYNPSSPEAFFKLGEAEQKLNHADSARACFQKVVDLAPDSKLASEAKKKVNGKS